MNYMIKDHSKMKSGDFLAPSPHVTLNSLKPYVRLTLKFNYFYVRPTCFGKLRTISRGKGLTNLSK